MKYRQGPGERAEMSALRGPSPLKSTVRSIKPAFCSLVTTRCHLSRGERDSLSRNERRQPRTLVEFFLLAYFPELRAKAGVPKSTRRAGNDIRPAERRFIGLRGMAQ